MKIYTLHYEQQLDCTLDKAWQFFSDPDNLAKITPSEMGFEIKKVSLPGSTYAGQLIRYKVTVLPGIRVSWLTEITHVEAPNYFVDEQRFGPYQLWHHQHKFTPNDKGVHMIDEVNYKIPFGILGRIFHSIYIRKKLERIFEFRKEAVLKHL